MRHVDYKHEDMWQVVDASRKARQHSLNGEAAYASLQVVRAYFFAHKVRSFYPELGDVVDKWVDLAEKWANVRD